MKIGLQISLFFKPYAAESKWRMQKCRRLYPARMLNLIIILLWRYWKWRNHEFGQRKTTYSNWTAKPQRIHCDSIKLCSVIVTKDGLRLPYTRIFENLGNFVLDIYTLNLYLDTYLIWNLSREYINFCHGYFGKSTSNQHDVWLWIRLLSYNSSQYNCH